MNVWQTYQKKLTTAEEAVKIIRSGDTLDYGWCTNQIVDLDKALAHRMVKESELTDLLVRGGVVLWQPEITKLPGAAERVTWNSWHTSGIERKLMDQGLIYYTPVRYSEMPRYYREELGPIHVAMFQVAPMDKHGYFNFGPNASHLSAVCEASDVIIVEVNRNMPTCLGGWGESIHINNVDMVVEGDDPPMAQLPSTVPSAVDEAVARLIVSELRDGMCLQLGIGAMPNAVGSLISQSDLKDLGVHTEMYVDAFVDMAEAGRITGRYKNVNKGRQVYAFAAGTQKLYDYLDQNPGCMAAPVDYVNDIRTIAAIDNFVSINNAVEVDLWGQITAESSGPRHISGSGGAQDFLLGAYLSKGGKSFVCCSSTVRDKDGSVKSRITPYMTPGSVVTGTRTNIHYLVTEYGIVDLKGASTWQRAERIISVAHPDFREELIAQAEKLNIWRKSNQR